MPVMYKHILLKTNTKDDLLYKVTSHQARWNSVTFPRLFMAFLSMLWLHSHHAYIIVSAISEL